MVAFQALLEKRKGGLHVVSYEDMVLAPKETQETLARSLKLKIRHDFAKFNEAVAFNEDAVTAMHGLRPPDSKSVGRWRRDGEQLAYVRSISAELEPELSWLASTRGYDVAF